MFYAAFQSHGGILSTRELHALSLSSRQIARLVSDGIIEKIKHGYYGIPGMVADDRIYIARLFPDAVLFLESALLRYGYTDRISESPHIAVDKDSNKAKYQIVHPPIKPFFIESKYISLGSITIEVQNISIRIYDRDRTICDILRYEKKLEAEVFRKALDRYIADPSKHIGNLFSYAEELNIVNKVQTYTGVRL